MKIFRLFVAFALVCFGLSPVVQALSPAPDGCYPGFTTAEGCDALNLLTAGEANTGLGWRALFSVGAGNFNTAVGAGALVLNAADSNTAIGTAALLLNTNGTENTANGTAALEFNDHGSNNTALGAFALLSNTTGNGNTAIGWEALFRNTGSVANTAVGLGALASMTAGTANTAIGANALDNLTTGSFNIVVGQSGAGILTASNVICIGSDGANTSDTTWVGNIYGVTTISGTTAPVVVSDGGQLGTVVSSERFKKDISTMEKASEPILALRPVTFHYKSDTKNTPQFGLIAEEVAKVNPSLVLPDKDGKPYTVRYDAVNAMLLNEFLKEHRKVQRLETALAAMDERLKVQDAKIQAVNDKVELGRPAQQAVLNNP